MHPWISVECFIFFFSNLWGAKESDSFIYSNITLEKKSIRFFACKCNAWVHQALTSMVLSMIKCWQYAGSVSAPKGMSQIMIYWHLYALLTSPCLVCSSKNDFQLASYSKDHLTWLCAFLKWKAHAFISFFIIFASVSPQSLTFCPLMLTYFTTIFGECTSAI